MLESSNRGNFNLSTLDLKNDDSSRYQSVQNGNRLRTELTTVASGVAGGLGAGGLEAGGLGAGGGLEAGGLGAGGLEAGLGAGGLGAGDGFGAGGATGAASAGAAAPTRFSASDAESSDEADDESHASSSSALWSFFGKTMADVVWYLNTVEKWGSSSRRSVQRIVSNTETTHPKTKYKYQDPLSHFKSLRPFFFNLSATLALTASTSPCKSGSDRTW